MKLILFDSAWGEVDSQEADNVKILVDNSEFRIRAIDEGIAIIETSGRTIVIIPESTNAVGIVTT